MPPFEKFQLGKFLSFLIVKTVIYYKKLELGAEIMSIDVLQERIRKIKNPTVVDLTLGLSDLPPQFAGASGYGEFCRELLGALKGLVPAVRVGYTAFSILGAEGMTEMRSVLDTAAKMGYYVILDAPAMRSPSMAKSVAEAAFDDDAQWPCDGLIIDGYLGTDILKLFLPHCKKGKDVFCLVRTSNKSAPELQDLLTGTRLVHAAAADLYYRFVGDCMGKFGYSRVAVMAGGNSSQSLQSLRTKYPKLFLLVDDVDYPGCNAKHCSNAFDQFGHGSAVCVGPTITCAWQTAETDGSDFVAQAVAAVERMKKNLTRYIIIM